MKNTFMNIASTINPAILSIVLLVLIGLMIVIIALMITKLNLRVARMERKIERMTSYIKDVYSNGWAISSDTMIDPSKRFFVYYNESDAEDTQELYSQVHIYGGN